MADSYTITLSLPPRIVKGICKQYGHKDKIKNEEGKEVDNTETGEQFCEKIVKQFCKEVTVAAEANAAVEAARVEAVKKANAEITL